MRTEDPIIVVATILSENGPTGVQAHFNALRHALILRGKTSILITPYTAPRVLVYPVFAVRRLIDRLSGPASVWWYRYWHALFLRSALKRRLTTIKHCVVYAQCPLSAQAALRARRNTDQRVVMIVHFNCSQADEWSDKGAIGRDGLMARSIRKLESRVLPSLDGIVYVSRYMQCELERAIPSLRKIESAVIPNFCFAPVAGDEKAKSVDVINVGTLEPRKNQQFLLEVLAHAVRAGKHFTLALVGDGPDRLKLERIAHRLGIERQVRFLGNQPRAVELMKSARLYAHSATIENLPLSLIEAMACGLPVVAPAVGGIPELFEPGHAGIYWNLGDVQAAAESLIDLLADESRLASMGLAARARFHERFDSAQIVGRLYDYIVNADTRSGEVEAQHAFTA